MTEARKRRDQPRTLLLSTTLAELKNREFELKHPPSDDETIEVIRRALQRRRDGVAAHAVRPLAAARLRGRTPSPRPDVIRTVLAQVAELSGALLSDDAIRAEAVPDLATTLELLAVPGSALEGAQLVALRDALGAARLVGAELGRLTAAAPRTAALRAAPVPKEIEPRLRASLDPEGELLG